MSRAALIALLCSVALPAMALDEPAPPGKEDPNVKVVAYSQFNRTVIYATVGRMTNVTFSNDERIRRVTFGVDDGPIAAPDPKKVGPAPMFNNLPLQGKFEGVVDVVVQTLLPDGGERNYLMLIKVRPAPSDGKEDPTATYGLLYTYPREQKAVAQEQAAAAWRVKKAADVKKIAEDRLAVDPFYGQRNFKYLAHGYDRDLAPTEASDNGRITALRYPGNMEIPTVLRVVDTKPGIPDVCFTGQVSDDKGEEHAVSTTQYDDMIVIQQTAPHFRLRLSEKKVLEIYNCGWDAIGNNPGTGTTSPEVIRRVVIK